MSIRSKRACYVVCDLKYHLVWIPPSYPLLKRRRLREETWRRKKVEVKVKDQGESFAGVQVGIKAPRGLKITCKSWQTEAAMRMLMNNLDPEVAEKPSELIVYGGSGKAARNWEAYHLLIKCLRDLEKDETLLVQSGKPVGIFKTHEDAPRVLISNSMLVPKWANWEKFRELEELGLTMYGQMTAGSWIYIGTQGILQGTYETFASAAKKHFGGTLKGRLLLSAGLGGMGGAQPLAVTMNEGVFLGVEVDRARINRRLETGYLDVMVDRLEDALILALGAKEKRNSKVDWSGWKCSRDSSRNCKKRDCSGLSDRPDLRP